MSKRINDGLPLAAAVFIIAVVALIVFMIVGNYAYAADSWVDGEQITDYSTSVASGIIAADTTRWNTASGVYTNTLAEVMSNGNIAETNLDLGNFAIIGGSGTKIVDMTGGEEQILDGLGNSILTLNGGGAFLKWVGGGTAVDMQNLSFNGTRGDTIINATDGSATLVRGSDAGTIIDLENGDRRIDMVLSSTNLFTYFGPSTVNGSWRMGIVTNSFVTERRESSTWVRKQTIAP